MGYTRPCELRTSARFFEHSSFFPSHRDLPADFFDVPECRLGVCVEGRILIGSWRFEKGFDLRGARGLIFIRRQNGRGKQERDEAHQPQGRGVGSDHSRCLPGVASKASHTTSAYRRFAIN